MPEEGSAHGVPMELWREQGGTELLQALPRPCSAQGSARVGAAAKSCFEYISSV